MKYFVLTITILFAQTSLAQNQLTTLEPLQPLDNSIAVPQPSNPGADNEFSGGAPEFNQIVYTPAYISKVIADNMKIQCFHGLCEMAMVDTRGQSFTAEVNAGYGNPNATNGGAGGSGGIVVVNPGTNTNTTPQPYFGVTIRYVTQHCTQSVRVPTSLYVSMNTYLYSLINEDGTTKRTFDPAEQTMILFYTTILKQTTGCSTATR